LEQAQAAELVGRAEQLLEELERLPAGAARDTATDAIGALLDLYGEGLARMVDVIAERDSGELAEALAGDELVAHLLLLHGLHPIPLDERLAGALNEVRPYLESHGGDVELLGVESGVVRLRLEGSCSGCPSSTVTLKLAIENAIHKAAPDVAEIVAEGVEVPSASPGPTLLQIEVPESMQTDSWTMAGGLPDLDGDPLLKQVAGEDLLFLRLNDSIYAYRPECPCCHKSVAGGTLERTELTCPACGVHFDVMRAGRCLDRPQYNLEPVPLLVDEAGLVRVALGAAA
jgi:Fe-S cluster biogenesis protein NfuA/nitrite reductase/ring-hydroxylating ferredoxin subunit